MNDSILWIVDGWRYWDAANGNSYHLTRLTHTRSGKSAIFEECEGNVRSYVLSTGSTHANIHTAPIKDITRGAWQRKLKCEYYAPVNQYHCKRGKVTNITSQIINKLRRVK